MKTAAWNTGRLYTKAGQRIGVVVITHATKGGYIAVFSDADRMVDGAFPLQSEPDSERDLREVTMQAYDFGAYENAWEYDAARREALKLALAAPVKGAA